MSITIASPESSWRVEAKIGTHLSDDNDLNVLKGEVPIACVDTACVLCMV
jgi:hypothetical protein